MPRQGTISRAGVWWRALKPGSWGKLLVPMVLGQAIGIEAGGRVAWGGLVLGTFFTLALIAFVVLLNDYGDRRVDRLKRALYPEGCAPKTIPDGLLPARALRNVGTAIGWVALGVALAAESWLQRPGTTLAALGCLLLFLAYTFPPLQLNYRGGGELLESIGVGLALPWWNAYVQGGEVWPAGLLLLPGFCLLAASSAVGSGLADERSDALGGKRTVVGSLGNDRTKLLAEALVAAAALVWAAGAVLDGAGGWMPALLPASLWLLLRLVVLRRLHAAAVTDAFRELRRWKGSLNGAIAASGAWIATVLVLRVFVNGWSGGGA